MRILAWPARANAASNPYQKLLYDAIEVETGIEVSEFRLGTYFAGRPQILHLHWPDIFLAAGRGLHFWPRYLVLRAILAVARLRGTKVIWTAHNLQRDGQRNAEQLTRHFWPWFLRRVDGVIFMTQASAGRGAEVSDELAGKLSVVIPHGHYRPVIGPSQPLPPPDGPLVALFFGSIARYKAAWKVLKSFSELPPRWARLEIRGRTSSRSPDRKLIQMLTALPAERAEEVVFEDRFLPDDELVARIRAADLVVFPYTEVLNSGAAIFALSVGRPILASDNALFRELQEMVGPEWVRLIEGEWDGAQLSAALDAGRVLRRSGAVPDLSAFDWPLIAKQTAAFYYEVAEAVE